MIMEITQVERQKKNPRRFNIFLNGVFAFGADEDTVVNFRLLKGKKFEESDLDKILFETEVGKIMDRMYGLFGIRQRSEKEVRDYLRNLSFKRKIKDQEEISEVVIENVIQRLKVKNLINDEQFAKAWMEARQKSKLKGKRAIAAELYQKGIDREIVNELLSNESTEQNSEENLAEQALEKKMRSLKNLPEMELKRKALEFLMRKGFDYSVAKETVEKVLRKDI
jgi:regulatory protein